MAGKTLYDKVWDAHLVGERKDGNSLIYIDLQLLHEVTSPQAFEGLTNHAPLRRGFWLHRAGRIVDVIADERIPCEAHRLQSDG